MSQIGLLRNPASSGNRRAGPLALPAGVPVAEPTNPAATGEAVATLLAQGVRRIAIDGGDGTVRLAIAALLRHGAAGDVALVLLRRGNTNLFYREIGGWGGALPEVGAGTLHQRPVLCVRGAGVEHYGMILGLGAYERASRLAAARPGPRGGAGVAAAILRALAQAAFQGPEGPWRCGVALAIRHDGAEVEAGPRLLFTATVAERRLPFGLDPFGRDGAQGKIRWLDVDAPGRRLLAAAPLVLMGRQPQWLTAAGYRRGRSDGIEIQGASALVIDGDVVENDPAATLSIGLSPALQFLVPEAPQQARAPAVEPAEGSRAR
ncbi:MAG: diacylglycerol kinase family protein [Pseudomonadota bacterium]